MTWEYTWEIYLGLPPADALNRYGAKGWELVSVTPYAQGSRPGWTYTFKRPASSEKDL